MRYHQQIVIGEWSELLHHHQRQKQSTSSMLLENGKSSKVVVCVLFFFWVGVFLQFHPSHHWIHWQCQSGCSLPLVFVCGEIFGSLGREATTTVNHRNNNRECSPQWIVFLNVSMQINKSIFRKTPAGKLLGNSEFLEQIFFISWLNKFVLVSYLFLVWSCSLRTCRRSTTRRLVYDCAVPVYGVCNGFTVTKVKDTRLNLRSSLLFIYRKWLTTFALLIIS